MTPRSEPPYQYGERQIEDMSARAFRFGEGRISGFLSLLLGVMSLLAVLCFRYPTYLTTAELRAGYDLTLLRQILACSVVASLVFGVLTFVLAQRKWMGAVGSLATLLALALGGATVPAGEARAAPVALGVDWLLLDLLASATLFILVEKLWPRYRAQVILRPEWKTDFFYFAFNHLLLGLGLLVSNHFAPELFGWAVHDSVQSTVRAMPVWAQVIVLVLAADFALYWIHRVFHEHPRLWRFHAVHHSTEHMDWLAGSRSHLVEVLMFRAIAMVPLYLLGPDKAALDAYVVFAALQAVFTHANAGIPTGPLKYLLVTPQFHHWHHSSDKPAIDTNYAVHLPLYDWLFGTYHMPEAHWPIAYGTVTRLPRTFLRQLTYPFRND